MNRRETPWILLAAATLLTTACASESGSRNAFSIRDSAGIAIAENTGEPPADGGGWAIAPDPILQIGSMEGDEGYLLFRVWGASRLSDGRIAVANNRAPDVRVFSAAGEHLHTFGQRGEGPEDFEGPVLMGTLPGDTLVVVDRTLRRINLYDPDEGFIRGSTATREVPGYLLISGMFSSGSIVAWASEWDVEMPNGLYRFPRHYWSVSLDGGMETDFGEFPGDETMYRSQAQGEGTIVGSTSRPFGKYPSVAISGSRFFFGSQDTYEIQVYAQDGRLLRLIRRDKEPIPVADTHVSAVMEEAVAQASDDEQARQFRQMFREAPIPDFHPAYGSIYADKLGYLWVEEYRLPGEERRLTTIFDPEGKMVGSVTLPNRFQVTEIGADYILGRYVDELGVEYLRMHTLRRPGRDPEG
jgi:hypothetical protein